MAKKKSTSSRKAGKSALSVIGRALNGLWKSLAKAVGSTIRFLARGARDLDPAHHRDGLAFLLLIWLSPLLLEPGSQQITLLVAISTR